MLRKSKKSRKKEEEGLEKGISEDVGEDFPRFSWWTTRKKVLGAALLAGFLGVVGAGTYRLVSEGRRRAKVEEQYDRHVRDSVTPYTDHTIPEKVTDTCIIPERTVEVFKDSRYIYGSPKKKFRFSASGRHRVADPPCILPAQGDQEIDLESRIRISRLDYDDMDSRWHDDTGISFVPSLPGILAPEFTVSGLKINSKDIPLQYLEIRLPTRKHGQHFYLNLSRLVRDGILTEKDFNRDLEVKLKSYMDLKPHFSVMHLALFGADRYGPLPSSIQDFTRPTKVFPSDHVDIKGIVAAYGGPPDVLPKLMYSLLVTDAAFEYKVQESDLPIIKAMHDGEGDCSEYSALFVTIARGFGIPARKLSGVVLDSQGKFDGYHAWAEVLVPLRNGEYRWVIVEPTWADDSARPFSYIGYQSDKHLYFVDFDAVLDPGDGSDRYSVFQRHSWSSRKKGGR